MPSGIRATTKAVQITKAKRNFFFFESETNEPLTMTFKEEKVLFLLGNDPHHKVCRYVTTNVLFSLADKAMRAKVDLSLVHYQFSFVSPNFFLTVANDLKINPKQTSILARNENVVLSSPLLKGFPKYNLSRERELMKRVPGYLRVEGAQLVCNSKATCFATRN